MPKKQKISRIQELTMARVGSCFVGEAKANQS